MTNENQLVKPAEKREDDNNLAISLDLNQFIRYFDLDMILNNTLISIEVPCKLWNGITQGVSTFELYNYETLLNQYIDQVTEDVKNDLENKTDYMLDCLLEYHIEDYDTTEEIFQSGVTVDDLQDEIRYYCTDSMDYECYQYFIISEYDLQYWTKYTDYPIFYNDKLDVYLLGITHYGMSWSYFPTEFYIPLTTFHAKYGHINHQGHGYYNYKNINEIEY